MTKPGRLWVFIAATLLLVATVGIVQVFRSRTSNSSSIATSAADVSDGSVRFTPIYDRLSTTVNFRMTNNSEDIRTVQPALFEIVDTHGEGATCTSRGSTSEGNAISPPQPGEPIAVAGGSTLLLPFDCVFDVVPRSWITYVYDGEVIAESRVGGE